jgi:hypothetical protein
MLSTYERRIQAIVICITLALHIFILCVLFIFTHPENIEPLRITADPQFIEYLLNNIVQHPNNPPTQNAHAVSPTLPAMSPALAHTIQQQIAQSQTTPIPDETGFDTYTLKNAVSYGSFSQGSMVTPGQEYGNPQATDNQAEQPAPEQEELAQDEAIAQNDTPEQKSESNEDNKVSSEQDPTDQETAPEQEDQLSAQANSLDDQEQSSLDSMSGISPLIAQAEAIINDSGSSWITQTHKDSQPHTNSHNSTGIKTIHHAGTTGSSQASRKTGTPHKSLTLADITRSYVKQVHKEQNETGHYTYNKNGSSSGSVAHGIYAPPASGVALSEQLYASKLYNLLEQSAQAYSNQIYSCNDLDMQTIIEVTIEKNGKILDVTLNPPIPEKDMERALCLIVKKVGLFPPIPRQFHKQRIILSIPIHIHSRQGFASYRLLYGLSTV